MMVVYKTTNLVNGKYYIGKQKKYTRGYLGSGIALKHAVKKHGKNNFIKEILEICDTEKELQRREIFWIDKFNAVADKQSYNLIRETSPNKHRRYSDPEYRHRLSQSITRTLNTPEAKERLKIQNGGENNPMFGKKRTNDFKQKISKIHRGKQLSECTKNLIRRSRVGKVLSPETKEKMKASQKARWDNIVIEVHLEGGYYELKTREDFKIFIAEYNKKIPRGRVRGPDPKRINWKKALKGKYNFIRVIRK